MNNKLLRLLFSKVLKSVLGLEKSKNREFIWYTCNQHPYT